MWSAYFEKYLLERGSLLEHLLKCFPICVLILSDCRADVLNHNADLLHGVAAGDEIAHRIDAGFGRLVFFRIDKSNVLIDFDKER